MNKFKLIYIYSFIFIDYRDANKYKQMIQEYFYDPHDIHASLFSREHTI